MSIHIAGPPRAWYAWGGFASLALIGALVAILLNPSPAAASSVQCAGAIAPDETEAGGEFEAYALKYHLMCDQPVVAYSLVFSRQIDLFSPEVIGTKPDGEGSGELASCEGQIPGNGLGCNGKLAPGNTFTGEFETRKPYCAAKRPRRGPFEAYLTVVTTQKTASGSDYTTSSQPFHLNRVECPKPKTKNKEGHR